MHETDYTKKLIENNACLNEEEYGQGKTFLRSYPQTLFVEMDAPCNQNCIFCSRPDIYPYFDLDEYKKHFEKLLSPVLLRARNIMLTGSGELLTLSEAKRNLLYFDSYKYAAKMFATNGSSLTPKWIDFLAERESFYTIHVSLHSTNSEIHRAVTAATTFPAVMHNLGYLKTVKADNCRFNFIFVATRRNIENLPAFVKFAKEHGAAAVIVYFYYIYRRDQVLHSCFFHQEFTNDMLCKAEEIVKGLNAAGGKRMELCLPPRFGASEYPPGGGCREAWQNFMINAEGAVLSCDVSGDSRENLKGKKDFMDLWNGEYFRKLRENLVSGKNNCDRYCFRANPGAVNDLRAHLITRGKTEKELEEMMNTR